MCGNKITDRLTWLRFKSADDPEYGDLWVRIDLIESFTNTSISLTTGRTHDGLVDVVKIVREEY